MVLMKLCTGQQWRQTYIERTSFWTQSGGEEGAGEMYGESYMETYVTICKIDSQREFAL